METPWQFATNAKSDAYCREIVAEMVRLFELTEQEAVGRLNQHWRGQDILDEYDIVYHELPEHWAHVVYLGRDSYWWITGEKREELGLGPITPKPHP